MRKPYKIVLAGIGKIARDQHLPVLRRHSDFDLVAAVSRHATVEGVRTFATLEEALSEMAGADAISFATPPKGRAGLAMTALKHIKHVMLEKPPAVSCAEIEPLAALARQQGTALFASWHSRAASAVAPARRWLEGKTVKAIKLSWLENIREWHPGQDWILEAEGMGVFDPGINGLSVLTAVLPGAYLFRSADLYIPENRQSPIAARALFEMAGEVPVRIDLDFLHEGTPRWDIEVNTTEGVLVLSQGGARMRVEKQEVELSENNEYTALYGRFAELIEGGGQDVDLSPLALTEEILHKGARITAPSFDW